MTPDYFIMMVLSNAQSCAAVTHLPLAALIAVPALETGWGQILSSHGTNTYNLFNIKGVGPAGQFVVESVEWLTVEEWQSMQADGILFTLTGRIEDGKHEGLIAQTFRKYNCYSEAYEDFYRVLRAKPRYSQVLRARDPYWFCTALHLSGYATDPKYADKLHNILSNRVIPALEKIKAQAGQRQFASR